jgi:hypothetical protein
MLGNTLGTWGEHIENNKNPTPPLPHSPQKKNNSASHHIACQEFLCLPLLFVAYTNGSGMSCVVCSYVNDYNY